MKIRVLVATLTAMFAGSVGFQEPRKAHGSQEALAVATPSISVCGSLPLWSTKYPLEHPLQENTVLWADVARPLGSCQTQMCFVEYRTRIKKTSDLKPWKRGAPNYLCQSG